MTDSAEPADRTVSDEGGDDRQRAALLPRAAPARLVAAAATLPAVSAAVGARTLPDILDWHADRHPNRVHAPVEDDETVLGTLTYGQLRDDAMTVATGLVERGILPGDRVALMLPSREFFAAFMGTRHILFQEENKYTCSNNAGPGPGAARDRDARLGAGKSLSQLSLFEAGGNCCTEM